MCSCTNMQFSLCLRVNLQSLSTSLRSCLHLRLPYYQTNPHRPIYHLTLVCRHHYSFLYTLLPSKFPTQCNPHSLNLPQNLTKFPPHNPISNTAPRPPTHSPRSTFPRDGF